MVELSERKARERLEFENDLYFSDQVYNWFVGHFPAVYLWTAYAGKTRSHQNLLLTFYKDKEDKSCNLSLASLSWRNFVLDDFFP